jgi:lipopolysaccharide transport system ATP-binding protein
MSETLIKVESVSKKFCRSLKKSLWYGMQDLGREITGRRHGGDGKLRSEEFWAVKDVSFELKRGECLGLIGHNGAGKTTLLRMLNGLIKPDSGRIEMRGRVGALIALGAGFNPILTGRENIYVNASVLGLSKREIDEKIDEIIDFADIGDFIDAPVQSYSSGMQVRLGFAVATSLEPDVLLLDEVFAVGDAAFRARCYNKIGSLLSKAAVVLVSHSTEQLAATCSSGLVLERGAVFFKGEIRKSVYSYLNSTSSSAALSQQKDQFCQVFPPLKEVKVNLRSSASLDVGNDLNLQVSFTTKEKTVFRTRLQIYDSSWAIAAESNWDHEYIMSEGESTLNLKIPCLLLNPDKYFVSLIFYRKVFPEILFWSRGQCRFEVIGTKLHTTAYQIPLVLEEIF